MSNAKSIAEEFAPLDPLSDGTENRTIATLGANRSVGEHTKTDGEDPGYQSDNEQNSTSKAPQISCAAVPITNRLSGTSNGLETPTTPNRLPN